MNVIEVTLRTDTEGMKIPLSFIWKGETYQIDSIERRWNDDKGENMLVVEPLGRAFHLRYTPDGRWHLVRGEDRPTVV